MAIPAVIFSVTLRQRAPRQTRRTPAQKSYPPAPRKAIAMRFATSRASI